MGILAAWQIDGKESAGLAFKGGTKRGSKRYGQRYYIAVFKDI